MRLRLALLTSLMTSVMVPSTLVACSSSPAATANGSSNPDGSNGTPSPTDTPDGGDVPPGTTNAVLPATTFLYVARNTPDRHVLMAWDIETDTKSVVTDLTGDGSSGWDIAGYAISPDRRSIAMATLYQPTAEDTKTGLAARRIFTLAADGTNFKRLTPVWENRGAGRPQWQIDVRAPMWTRDGGEVLFSYGEYWYEGSEIRGGSSVWGVSAAGDTLPELALPLPGCTVSNASTDPATGKIAVLQSVCIDRANEGIWLYSRDGSTTPEQLVGRGGAVDPSLEPVSWAKDGSGFFFVGTTSREIEGSTRTARGAFGYDIASDRIFEVAVPSDPNVTVRDITLAPNASAAIYCVVADRGGALRYDLHAVDLTVQPLVGAPITDDGTSCSPRW